MSRQALTFEKVCRRFGRKTAVDELDLRVEPGTVLGLVGRNGSGKTTALRLAHGVLHPDSGTIRVLGLDPVEQGLEVRRRVSLLSEESFLYPWMRVGHLIDFAAALHPRWDRKLADDLVGRLDLDPGERVKALSRGTRAKVALVLAVACRPDLLLLDDPTAGLDPLVRREVLQGVLESVSEEGGAVVYASHLIHDIERMADRIAYLDAGRVRLEGSLEALKARIRRGSAVFEGDAPTQVQLPGQIDCEAEGRVLRVVAQGTNGELAGALRAMGAREVEVEALSLEEILVACLRHGPKDVEVDHV